MTGMSCQEPECESFMGGVHWSASRAFTTRKSKPEMSGREGVLIIKLRLLQCAAIAVGCLVATPIPAYAQAITSFDPPGSFGTFASTINDAGEITGYYWDSSYSPHGFVRDASGTITSFDPPGSGWTEPTSINPAGEITGWYRGLRGDHGFVRDASGTITSFDVPGSRETVATSINPAGEVTGDYEDSGYATHGFVRDARGTFTSFDVPGALGGPFPSSINPAGEITGFYRDSGGVAHGFVRTSDTTPPVTVASTIPTPNTAGWNNSNAVVNLTATDDPGSSGVRQIQFTLAGAQNGTQTIPGATAAITISNEGSSTLTYSATDNAGNVESPKSLTLKIDKTPPVISGMPAAGCSLWPPNHRLVQVGVISASDALSGLLPGSFTVAATSSEPIDPNDPAVVITTNGSGGYVVQLQAERLASGNGRVYTLNANARDLAGNSTTATWVCAVPHDQKK